MKVSSLIRELQKWSPDSEVVFINGWAKETYLPVEKVVERGGHEILSSCYGDSIKDHKEKVVVLKPYP